ncbi:unnamed protein product [Amaranthus hypochondriacus]
MQNLILSLLILSLFFLKECTSQRLVPSIYVFGDSLTDAGNNPMYSPARAFYRPYGVNFPSPSPTGRFTDGKTFPDIIAEYLGLEYPQAYGKNSTWSEDGYTYASAGCGILQETGKRLFCKSLDKQIKSFEDTIMRDKLESRRYPNPADLREHLSNSLFIVWAGSNDYLLNYFMKPNPPQSPQEFAQLLIDTLSANLKKLHDLGARKILVLEVGPLGCLPVYKLKEGHDEKWCHEGHNSNAMLFNQGLATMIQNLVSTYPDSLYTLGKIYDVSNDAYVNPEKYGLRNVSHSCCKIERQFVNKPSCIRNSTPCPNAHEYLFFDGAHPTEASFQILAAPCTFGSNVCVPYNIQQLVHLQPNSPNHLHSEA